MSFRRRIKFFLVHTALISNQKAQELLDAGQIEIDGQVATTNIFLPDLSEVKLGGKVLRERRKYTYLRFHKPPGFESSLHPQVSQSIFSFFPDRPELAIAGRLDKASEGLLILSDDGRWVEYLCNPKHNKEKEYLAKLDRSPDEAFLRSMGAGVRIGNYVTQPCACFLLPDNTVRIILKEGKNRQIRRMCWNLGYEVIRLTRTRIGNLELSGLASGCWESFIPDEI